jgi:hypothetical protein
MKKSPLSMFIILVAILLQLSSITSNKCFSSCLTCNIEGTSQEHQCTECKTGYYPIEIENLTSSASFNCYNEKPSGYYLGESSYKPCDKACGDCQGEGDGHCLTCNDGYALMEDNLSTCKVIGVDLPGYTYEKDVKIFKTNISESLKHGEDYEKFRPILGIYLNKFREYKISKSRC